MPQPTFMSAVSRLSISRAGKAHPAILRYSSFKSAAVSLWSSLSQQVQIKRPIRLFGLRWTETAALGAVSKRVLRVIVSKTRPLIATCRVGYAVYEHPDSRVTTPNRRVRQGILPMGIFGPISAVRALAVSA